MGVDGFSIANTGLNINKTSSAMSSEAEALARLGNDVQIRDIDGVTKKAKTARKDRDAGFNGMAYLPENNDENEEEEQPETPQKKGRYKKRTNIAEDFSKYHFRLNKEQMIEIYDSQTGQILRVISPEDAMKVFVNLADVPGVIVNKKA